MNKHLNIDIAWGGYYAATSKENDEVSVFRLIDFNRDAYHISIYNETFKSCPSEEEIGKLTLFIQHVPIDSKGLLNDKEIILIKRAPLTSEDLTGYMYYLEEFEVSAADREELGQSLISFSQEPPLKLKLSVVDDELQINERQ